MILFSSRLSWDWFFACNPTLLILHSPGRRMDKDLATFFFCFMKLFSEAPPLIVKSYNNTMSFSRAWSHGLWTEYGSMVTYNQRGWLWMGSPTPRTQWWCKTWRPPKCHRWWAKTLSFLLVFFRLARILIVEWQSVQHGCNTLSSAMAQLSSDSSLEWFVSFTKYYCYWYTFFNGPLRYGVMFYTEHLVLSCFGMKKDIYYTFLHRIM